MSLPPVRCEVVDPPYELDRRHTIRALMHVLTSEKERNLDSFRMCGILIVPGTGMTALVHLFHEDRTVQGRLLHATDKVLYHVQLSHKSKPMPAYLKPTLPSKLSQSFTSIKSSN
jgi:hypothetical protein